MSRVASLGMYDHPAQQAANDDLWRGIAARLRDAGIDGVPERLDRSRSVETIWRDPDLLLAQACGYPLIGADAPAVRVVALPIYDVAGCDGPRHRSVLVARATDRRATLAEFRGARAAINAPTSNTGMNLLRAAVAPFAGGAPFFSDVIVTGGHRASVEAIAHQTADCAAIDSVTWAALRRYAPALTEDVRVIGMTETTTALPFVTIGTATDSEVTAIRTALAAIIADPTLAAARDAVFLRDIVAADESALAPVRATEGAAAALGYPILR